MITIYADLNCPFCYALNEWICEQGLGHAVNWCLINHNPHASYSTFSNKELVELTEEVFTIRHRAPDIPIVLPTGRPNVAAAEQLLYAVKRQQPEKHPELRTAIYRAYWVNDCNIEAEDVLEDCLQQCNISGVEISPGDKDKLIETSEFWNCGPYERRLPVIQKNSGEFVLGLPTKEDLLSYLSDPDTPLKNTTINACSYGERSSIAVIGNWPRFWEAGKNLRQQSDLLYCPDIDHACQQISSAEGSNLLVMVIDRFEQEHMEMFNTLISHCLRHSRPLILFTQSIDDQLAVKLYKQGCSDILPYSINEEIFSFKIQNQIHQQQLLSDLLESSMTDTLTQLANKRSFGHSIELEWSRSARSKQPLSLLTLDIDYFKQYNDAFGHLAGDGCLREVADTIKSSLLRKEDRAFRTGGEEFAIILPGVDQQGAEKIAQRLLKDIWDSAIPHPKSRHQIVTFSIGIASHHYDPGIRTQDIIEQADQALYAAKGAGRNTFISYLEAEPAA